MVLPTCLVVEKEAATPITQEYPSLQVVHCLSHILEFAYTDALKGKIKTQYEETLTLLVGLCFFYKKVACRGLV